MLDLRQVGHELAVAVVDAVAAFGDGQRDDADLRIGEFVDQCLGAVFSQQHVIDRADHPDFGVIGVTQFVQGEQVVLAGQVIPGTAILGPQAHAADGPVQIGAGIHQRVGVIGLVRPVETADADVGDALADVAHRVGGQGDARVEVCAGFVG